MSEEKAEALRIAAVELQHERFVQSDMLPHEWLMKRADEIEADGIAHYKLGRAVQEWLSSKHSIRTQSDVSATELGEFIMSCVE